MIRVLNFFCVAVMGLSILALYDVSEHTRLARVDLARTAHEIAKEHDQISTLETEWQFTARPERVAFHRECGPDDLGERVVRLDGERHAAVRDDVHGQRPDLPPDVRAAMKNARTAEPDDTRSSQALTIICAWASSLGTAMPFVRPSWFVALPRITA